MEKVRKIESKISDVYGKNKKKKIVAYCRVSTKYESQKSSIEMQIKLEVVLSE